ncbi:MAG: 3-phosphoserine/phosphohydroxythreonine transaminase [Deltaproteobacteria bacterium]|nr:3-phosphoserine/phosphohydroxythreonine transaminase [Deltaproteobacteria bacterium]
MATNRIFNFNAGPSALPQPVLEKIQASLLDYEGCGMSVMEISHRSKWFDDIINDALDRVKRLLGISDDFEVLFMQGGASAQFYMIPMNLLPDGQSADYIDTGTWSTKAIKEAQIQNKTVRVAASSEDRDYCYIPRDIAFDPGAAYVHITSNNTIKGTQWATMPDTGGIPLVADMSSDIFCRPLDPKPFGMIYAGAQKNMGPAGVCLVVVRKDMLDRVPNQLPTMLKYTTFAAKNSMYNTPPCFAIYTVQQVLKWLEEDVGGLEKMAGINRQKADRIYGFLDAGDFYRGTADTDSRSCMNVTFRLPNEDLEKKFIETALENGFGGLKGHRSVGGCRASIYNPTALEAVTALVDFMKTFEKENG